jgi:hypothetical protein
MGVTNEQVLFEIHWGDPVFGRWSYYLDFQLSVAVGNPTDPHCATGRDNSEDLDAVDRIAAEPLLAV